MTGAFAAFCEAQLAGEEAAARQDLDSTLPLRYVDADDDAGPLLALFGADRVLLEVAGKRAVLALHQPRMLGRWQVCSRCRPVDPEFPDDLTSERWPCRTLRAQAAVWGGQPGYLEEWRP